MIVINKMADIEERNVRNKLPVEVCREINRLVNQLDELYGENRDENSDGGIIIIVERKNDLKTIKSRYASLDESDCEGEYTITTPKGSYVNQLYLRNNEYGVNVIIPERFLKGSAKS